MAQAAVEVSDDANGEGAEGVSYLGVGGEALGGEMVDNVPGKGDDEHYRHLLVPALVDDDETERERGHEDKFVPDRHGCPASGFVGRILIDGTENRGADRDTKAQKQRVYHGIYHTDGTSDDVPRLKLKRATEDCVAW